MRTKALKAVYLLVAMAVCIAGQGCTSGIYSNVPPVYDLQANQDKKVLIWIEVPHSAAADPDAADKLTYAILNHLVAKAKIKPDNVLVANTIPNVMDSFLSAPEAAAQKAGAGLVLFVRIESYELMPVNIRNFHSGRMLTRSVLLDAHTAKPLWPENAQSKQHDIVVELAQGDRDTMLSRLTDGTAHCISRNLYPIRKLNYKNSDERISIQEAFELETF